MLGRPDGSEGTNWLQGATSVGPPSSHRVSTIWCLWMKLNRVNVGCPPRVIYNLLILVLCLQLAQSGRSDRLHILADVSKNIVLFGTYPFNNFVAILHSCSCSSLFTSLFLFGLPYLILCNLLKYCLLMMHRSALTFPRLCDPEFRKIDGRTCSIPNQIDFTYSESCWHQTIIAPTDHKA